MAGRHPPGHHFWRARQPPPSQRRLPSGSVQVDGGRQGGQGGGVGHTRFCTGGRGEAGRAGGGGTGHNRDMFRRGGRGWKDGQRGAGGGQTDRGGGGPQG